MRVVAVTAGKALLFLVVGACLAIACVPPFLDRAAYPAPASDHFDGERFSNPDPDPPSPRRGAYLLRFLLGRERVPWPARVAVPRGYPPAEATACARPRGAIVEAWARCVPAVDPAGLWVTWIGHATALVQTSEVAILTDPIWSERAGPFGLVGPKRARAPGIAIDDLPKIDLVLVSHDHYDHLDLKTLKALWTRDRPLIVTGLGNDAYLRAHGIPAVARDWGGRVEVKPGVAVIVERVHHWSTRWRIDRNRTLWAGFTVELARGNLFFAGDTGLGDGAWVDAAAARGPIRLALLPIGAFLPRGVMHDHHIGPVEAVAAFRRLRAANALALHWGTFHLSAEAIDDPPRLLAATLARQRIPPARFRAIEVGTPWPVPPLPSAAAR